MSAAQSPHEDGNWPDAVAPATAPALPSLKKDNCIVNGNYRAVFVAQENIRLYIWKFGATNVCALTVTVSDCLSLIDFQSKWHSFLNALKKIFPTGVWMRERQPRSGNWHAHAVVNVGWDIKTNFPWEQVRTGFYPNVDPRLRKLWKYLREKGESRGFGRIELLPLKYSGKTCARYFAKYISKLVGSEKSLGEERCRLFGIWGGVRFVYPRFSFLSSRIVQKRKQWLANHYGLVDGNELKTILGPRWWFHYGMALSDVIMPADFYQVGPADDRHFDDIGLRAWSRDWTAWQTEPTQDLIHRSQFNLFWDIGERLYGKGGATAYAIKQMSGPEQTPSKPEGPQWTLDLYGTLVAAKKQFP